MTKKRDCPVCNGPGKKSLYRQRFSSMSGHAQLTGYDVVVCTDCGFAYADDIPDQDWFDAYYSDASKYTYDQRQGEVSPIDRARFRHITHMISGHLPDRTSRILDFGCATGSLLNHLKKAGYSDLLGIEKTPAAAQVAHRLYGLSVVNTDFASLARDEKQFDLLILSGVIEHIRDVKSLLKEMGKVLKRDALVYIEVPDAAGFHECMDMPFQEFSVEHINFFSTTSLTNLLAPYGYEPLELLRLRRDYTSNSKMSVLCTFFRFSGNSNNRISFDKKTLPALQSYIDRSLEEEKRISSVIDELVIGKTPLVVWGVGTYTLHLMQSTRFSELNIIAFADSNTNYQKRTLLGKPILAPSELKAYPQPILISTFAFRTEIQEQIRATLGLTNEIITL